MILESDKGLASARGVRSNQVDASEFQSARTPRTARNKVAPLSDLQATAVHSARYATAPKSARRRSDGSAGCRSARRYRSVPIKNSVTNCRERHAASQVRSAEDETTQALMRKYDKNGDRVLNRKELGALLKEISGDEEPDPQDVAWLIRMADLKDGDGLLDMDELHVAISTWQTYRQNKSSIDKVFARYDEDNSGKLEFNELKRVLTELNGNVAPENEEVMVIMRKADGQDGLMEGGIRRMELLHAIALWYAHVEEVKAEMRSQCCAIS